MFHLIPARAHRHALRLAHRLRLHWWRWRKPRLAGCRVLAIDSEGRVLLVRHSYGSGHWTAPGGGIGRCEAPLVAARRELLEETNCILEAAILLETVEEALHGAINMVHIVAGMTNEMPQPDGREIIEAAFFELDALPDRISKPLRSQLPAWVRAAIAARPQDAAAAPVRSPAPTGLAPSASPAAAAAAAHPARLGRCE
jgi:ADP-ribose pyrophosphatase YjhB (NUDIX family)